MEEPRHAHMRLALGVAHAVSCCCGFDPATHRAFWQRVIEKLWPGEGRAYLPVHMVLSSNALTHVGIVWEQDRDAGDAFWTGFFLGTPVLAQVVRDLAVHFVGGTMAPLYVSLSNCQAIDDPLRMADDESSPSPYVAWTDAVVDSMALRTILRAALATPTTAWATNMRLGLVVEYRIDDADERTREILDLLARMPTAADLDCSIDRIVVQFVPPKPPRDAAPTPENLLAYVARGRALGQFLRTLLVTLVPLRVDAVQLLWCSHGDYRLVGAALSAVALASPPVSELRCSGLCYATLPRHKCQRLAWLAFALLCRIRQSPLVPWRLALLSSGVAVDEHEREYMQTLVARGTPLRDVVREALHLRFGGDDKRVAGLAVECLQLGSTVRLARDSRLYFEPLSTDDGAVAVTTDMEEEVDWVAHVVDDGGVVGVVYAGYGLLWATEACVTAWHRQDKAVAWTTGALSSLSLFFEGVKGLPPALESNAFRIAPLVRVLACETVRSISIDRAVLLHDDLACLLECFPSLETLSLDRSLIESIEPLVDAYSEGRSRVAALSLLGARTLEVRDQLDTMTVSSLSFLRLETGAYFVPAWVLPLVHALAAGVARTVLRELHIDCLGMTNEQDERTVLAQLATAVETGALPLLRLHVACQWRVTCLTRRFPWADVVLVHPLRVRSAVLSVLRAFGCAVPEIANEVLALAAVVRTVTWGPGSHL